MKATPDPSSTLDKLDKLLSECLENCKELLKIEDYD
jgi:hypothetical protein